MGLSRLLRLRRLPCMPLSLVLSGESRLMLCMLRPRNNWWIARIGLRRLLRLLNDGQRRRDGNIPTWVWRLSGGIPGLKLLL
jgi:hypothetical protein